jgi:coenzyme F420 hydrogenase subunit delta
MSHPAKDVSVQSFFRQRYLILGCGNPLIGDDGFGPAVIAELETRFDLPDDMAVVDAGTSVRDILFDVVLSPEKPECIIIVDAMEQPGKQPGDIADIPVANMVPQKIADFSLHQFPTTNLLKEISEETGVQVHLMVVQPGPLPDEVRPGLSAPVQRAVPEMCLRILSLVARKDGARLHEEAAW